MPWRRCEPAGRPSLLTAYPYRQKRFPPHRGPHLDDSNRNIRHILHAKEAKSVHVGVETQKRQQQTLLEILVVILAMFRAGLLQSSMKVNRILFDLKRKISCGQVGVEGGEGGYGGYLFKKVGWGQISPASKPRNQPLLPFNLKVSVVHMNRGSHRVHWVNDQAGGKGTSIRTKEMRRSISKPDSGCEERQRLALLQILSPGRHLLDTLCSKGEFRQL